MNKKTKKISIEKELVQIVSNSTKNKLIKNLKLMAESVIAESPVSAIQLIKNNVKKYDFIIKKLEYNKETESLIGTGFYQIKEDIMGSFDFQISYK